MARLCFFTHFLLLSFGAFLMPTDSNPIKVGQSQSAAGVFMLIEGGRYTFNFTAARDACLFLNVTIATQAQMERAVRRGLETCKFGWIAEQIAVVPRLRAEQTCGSNKTGVVTWSARPDRMFGVFCYNASDLETPNTSTSSPETSTFSTKLKTLTKPLLISTTKSPPSIQPRTTAAAKQTAFTLPVKTTHSARILSTSAIPKTLSTHIPTSLSHLITSKPIVISSDFSAPAHTSVSITSSESTTPTSVSAAKPLGDVPTALIILAIIFLLITAAGVVWYYKLNLFSFWPQGQQKDDTETEMWKHTDSEMDLHSQYEGEEESDRMYSSDITLCVNPDITPISLEKLHKEGFHE
ncbi:Lymphatic vessel endothelial hyaluronic acid receptor 1 [Collichthys lucidus]|uniref:Lymphatic vessel endothelial hyaluronic acid receptor 1 n=1 Tax=Collichthys lucidus TaxID=240159 RepID=A0A4U5UK99_COLLU|nr:Lymphatic vessel endothelial hyaluronic acid receptor 1 [Collichthys lucidus]